MKTCLLRRMPAVSEIPEGTLNCSANAVHISGRQKVRGKKSYPTANTWHIRLRVRASPVFVWRTAIPGMWLIFIHGDIRVTRSVETETSCHHRSHGESSSLSLIRRQPRARAQSRTTGYLHNETLTTMCLSAIELVGGDYSGVRLSNMLVPYCSSVVDWRVKGPTR